jgi:hypothetical protein
VLIANSRGVFPQIILGSSGGNVGIDGGGYRFQEQRQKAAKSEWDDLDAEDRAEEEACFVSIIDSAHALV